MAVSRIGTRGNVRPAVVAAIAVATVAWVFWAVFAGDPVRETPGEQVRANLEPLSRGAVLEFFGHAWTDSNPIQTLVVLGAGVVAPVYLVVRLQENRIFRLDTDRGVIRVRGTKVPLDTIRGFALADRGLTVHILTGGNGTGAPRSSAPGPRNSLQGRSFSAHGVSAAQWPAVRQLAAAAGVETGPSREQSVDELRRRVIRAATDALGIVWRDEYESLHAADFYPDFFADIEEILVTRRRVGALRGDRQGEHE